MPEPTPTQLTRDLERIRDELESRSRRWNDTGYEAVAAYLNNAAWALVVAMNNVNQAYDAYRTRTSEREAGSACPAGAGAARPV